MNYIEKIENKTKEIDDVQDAFTEVKDRLLVLTKLNLCEIDYKLGKSIGYVIDEAILTICAIESKLDITEYRELPAI